MNARDVERFMTKVNVNGPKLIDTPCWLFTGGKDCWGYGMIGLGERVIRAHRFSFMMVNGPISKENVIMHRCDNPTCVNPAHLSSGTHAENMADARAKGRTLKSRHAYRVPPSTGKEILDLLGKRVPQHLIATRFKISVKTVQRFAKAFNRKDSEAK